VPCIPAQDRAVEVAVEFFPLSGFLIGGERGGKKQIAGFLHPVKGANDIRRKAGSVAGARVWCRG